eukprot:GHVT01090183.1.p1 GENE.GHVT01090183.1~~GHVT01090183.1.p1  ORF type:complete len:406 (+),score=0.20 GHVT01090183.1:856-2073(+)
MSDLSAFSIPVFSYLDPWIAQVIVWVTCLSFGAMALVFHIIRTKRRFCVVDESYFSAQSSEHWLVLAISIYASCMGNWALYAPADVGAMWSWAGVIGYALGNCIPLWGFAIVAMKVKQTPLAKLIFCGSDFILVRFGRTVHILVSIISVIIMFSVITAELSGIGTTIGALVGTQTEVFRLSVVIPVAFITLLYTAVAGLRASILTDRLQGIVVAALLGVLIASCASSAQFGPTEWAAASFFSRDGAIGGSVIFCSMIPVVLCDQGMWQRVIAARSARDVGLSFLVAGLLCFVSIFGVGVLGIVAKAQFPTYKGYNIIFLLIAQLNTGWQIVGAIVAVTLAASSLDTYQNGIAAVVGYDLKVCSRASLVYIQNMHTRRCVGKSALQYIPTFPIACPDFAMIRPTWF